MKQYELIFAGKIVEGFAAAQVKENVGKLFKANTAQVEQMFSGKRVVLRNKLDEATARKYYAVLKKNGADCELRAMGGTAPEPQPAAPQPQQAVQQTSTPAKPKADFSTPSPATFGAQTTPQEEDSSGRLPVAGEKVGEILQEVNWNLAPTGSNMEEQNGDQPQPELDLSHLDLAPPGEDLGQKKTPSPPSAPDTSHIELKR